jgi:hypothetical protein
LHPRARPRLAIESRHERNLGACPLSAPRPFLTAPRSQPALLQPLTASRDEEEFASLDLRVRENRIRAANGVVLVLSVADWVVEASLYRAQRRHSEDLAAEENEQEDGLPPPKPCFCC